MGVVGCGPIGLLVVALARSAGASLIVATDPGPQRLAAAAGLGASHVIEATGTPDDGGARA